MEEQRKVISMSAFGRRNLLASGFEAGLKACGIDHNELRRTDPARYHQLCKGFIDLCEAHNLPVDAEI